MVRDFAASFGNLARPAISTAASKTRPVRHRAAVHLLMVGLIRTGVIEHITPNIGTFYLRREP